MFNTPNVRTKFWRICAMFAVSIGLYLWSRGLRPWSGAPPASAVVVLAYAITAVLWAVTLSGLHETRILVSSAAWMAVAGLLVTFRSGSPALWLTLVVAGLAIAALLWNLVSIGKRIQQLPGRFHSRLIEDLLGLIPSNIKRLAAKELQLWIAIFRPSLLARGTTGQQFCTGHTGSEVAAMRILLGFGVIELTLVHLILHVRFPFTAMVILGISVVTLIYLFGVAQSLRSVPTTLEDTVLTVRLGVLRSKAIPLANIRLAEIYGQPSGDKGGALEFSIIDPPNIRLHLREPIEDVSVTGKVRHFETFIFRLDAPEDFVATLNACIG